MTEIEEVTLKAQKQQAKAKYFDPLHIPNTMLVVTYGGEEKYVMNKRLLDQQNCWTNLEAIKEVHWFKQMLYDMIRKERNSKKLKELAKDITECEFELQRLWKFTEDDKFHMFWETPKCQCPVLDNRDRYPTGYYVINLSCPLHGQDDAEKSKR